MTGFICPFCHQTIAVTNTTMHFYGLSFQGYVSYYKTTLKSQEYIDFINNPEKSILEVRFYKCPSCNKVTIIADGQGLLSGKSYFIHPTSNAKQFPEYIPQAIRNDYEEACEILHHSPKASATLSRRCLQGMIRDFYGISKGRLVDEINALEVLVPKTQWSAINAVRMLGNIGAHMEKDVNLIVDVTPDEADKLIRLIELLIDKWYIARHDEEQLYADIVNVNNEKQVQRSPSR